MVTLQNGSQTHFGALQCISMDHAAAAWCGYSLRVRLYRYWNERKSESDIAFRWVHRESNLIQNNTVHIHLKLQNNHKLQIYPNKN